MPAPKATPPRVLILGGTGEARALADLLAGQWGGQVEVIVSLAGRTSAPMPAPGRSRRGGFGGAEGLSGYLQSRHVAALIDATHPFATNIARHAREAAAACGVPRLVLRRPEWTAEPGDRWIDVPDHAAAAAALPALGRRVWLSFGDGLAAFAALTKIWFLVRRIEPPTSPLPLRLYEIVLGRGPFSVAGERDLIRRHRIDVLVSKASGGPATVAKIIAARELGLPVVMVRRPPAESGPVVDEPAAAAAWLAEILDGVPRSTA